MRALDGPDLFHLAQERPERPMHTLKVAVLERPLSCEEVDRWAGDVLPQIEPLRLRLARVGPSRPVWIDGGPPALAHHLRHHIIEAPGGEAELSAALADLCTGVLDRDRPLWRLWHLTGLASGGDALVLQLHHVVGDGTASAALWEAVADGAVQDATVTPPPSRARLAAFVAAGGAREVVRFPGQVRRFIGYLRHARAVERTGEPAVTKAFLGPPTRFNTKPEPQRRCTFVTLSLGRLREVRRAAGATLNDVFLTVSGGAVHRYLDALGEPPPVALTATVPAALPNRPSTFGNGVTTLYVSLHSDVADPLARLRAIQASVAATRRSTDRDPRLLPDWQRYPRLNGGLIRLMEVAERRGGRPAYNLIVSSVRGPEPFSVAGVPVVELRSLGPLAGHLGLNITAWSYGDDFTIGIHAYASAGDGLEVLGRLIVDELAELERRSQVAAASSA